MSRVSSLWLSSNLWAFAKIFVSELWANLLNWSRQPWCIWPWWCFSGEETGCFWFVLKTSLSLHILYQPQRVHSNIVILEWRTGHFYLGHLHRAWSGKGTGNCSQGEMFWTFLKFKAWIMKVTHWLYKATSSATINNVINHTGCWLKFTCHSGTDTVRTKGMENLGQSIFHWWLGRWVPMAQNAP